MGLQAGFAEQPENVIENAFITRQWMNFSEFLAEHGSGTNKMNSPELKFHSDFNHRTRQTIHLNASNMVCILFLLQSAIFLLNSH